jgi:hypothetical protein
METVKVVVNIPGLLEKGDILTSAGEGHDFNMFVKDGNFERSATIDYYSVCANIPTYFAWELDEEDTFVLKPEGRYLKIDEDIFVSNRSNSEINDRIEFFKDKIANTSNWEESVVYNNLIWFIDWLKGERELL